MVNILSQGLFDYVELCTSLQKIFHVLEDYPIIKQCFMDLALFPGKQRISVAALMDMWIELYGLDDMQAIDIINKLVFINLAKILVPRKNTSDTDGYYYSNYFIIFHDIIENKSEWWIGEKHIGMNCILSNIVRWCVNQITQQIPTRTLSISNDETCTSHLSNFQAAQAEVLILNLGTNQCSFPVFLKEMSKLKVLIVTNYGLNPSRPKIFEQLGSLSNLKRIRLEGISIPSFVKLENLQKLSLYLCNTRQAFENRNMIISDAFPNLQELNIDYCKDMVELPKGLCDITSMKTLSITNCHKLSALPQEIGNLENLKLLRLSSCTDLEGIPNSIGRLSNLRHVDFSNCISLLSLPEEFGNLCNLRNLYMTSCAMCELPFSITKLKNLKQVVCDEETATSWEDFESMLPNLKIDVPQLDVNLNWLHAIHS